jgi:hypothetical protein
MFSLLLCSNIFAQELNVISGGGAYSETTNGNLTYTIGEVVVNTIESPDYHITQGFNQDWINFLNINTFKEDINISIFPNPATHFINVESNKPADLKIYDINSKEVLSARIDKTKTIDLTSLSSGTYFLKFIQKNQNVKTFKVIIL